MYLLAVQGTPKSSPTPQFKSISSLVLSLLYGPTLTSVLTTEKIIALTIWTSVGKFMSLLLHCLGSREILSRFCLIAQLVENLPAIQETLVRLLGWEDLLEKG